MLRVENLAISMQHKIIIEDINFTIPEGSITSILGPNGCGKSTLLKAISGLNTNYQGNIYIHEHNIRKIKRSALAHYLAILPQGAVAPNDLTVRDLVSFGRFPYRQFWKNSLDTHDITIIEGAMERTKIGHLAHRYVNTLSGGERQRAWIAMALAQEPQMLLLDEPTTYLDIAHQLEVMKIITSLNLEEKMTIVMVLHDINHARIYSDNILIIKDHHLYVEGEPREVISKENLHTVFQVESEIYENNAADIPDIIFPIDVNDD